MADWYVSSAAYATYTAFQTSHAYTLGTIIVPTAPAVGGKYVFQCTVAGTSSTEPTWSSFPANNATVSSGTATFKNITGQSSFFWTAAAGDGLTLMPGGASRPSAGDRVLISSDHSETLASSTQYGSAAVTGFGLIQWLSVNRAGSTPPVAADLLAGASLACSSNAGMSFRTACSSYHYGITYSVTSATTTGIFLSVSSATNAKTIYFDNCQLWINSTSSTAQMTTGTVSTTIILNNSTLKFGHSGQTITTNQVCQFEFIWQNTPSNALAGSTFPSVLFNPFSASVGYQQLVTCRGVDLSNISGSLVTNALGGSKYLFESCKIASGVTRYNTTSITATHELVELVNCYDGTNFISEFHVAAGDVTTEFTITLSGGAADNVGAFSHKMVTSANTNKFVSPLAGFWMDVGNALTGSSQTATVEIISSASLNNDEVALYLQYEGTAGSSVASFADCFIATPLTTPAAVTTSTATWNSSPATPVKQKLQVTFTPQHAGRVRGQVRLGKASSTVYVNPQITIT